MRNAGLVMTLCLACWASCAPADDARSSDDRPSSGLLDVGGVELRWVREGTGPAVFVLGSSVYYPKAYSDRLREHFELVFLDGRHFIPDYAPDADVMSAIDLSTFADDVEIARLALGYDDIVVVGHSVHGQIALEYADLYPEHTARIVLIAAVPYAIEEFADEADAIWEQLASDERQALLDERRATLEAALAAAPASRSFAVTYNIDGPLYWADPTYDATAVLEGLENGIAFSRLIGTLPSPSEARARLERIQAPILLVLGRLDFAIPYTAWEELIAGLDGIEFVLLGQDSHNPQTESPVRFDPILIEWLSSDG